MRFMECMLKIGLEYLSYHGNPTQQAMIPASLLWGPLRTATKMLQEINDSTDNRNVQFS